MSFKCVLDFQVVSCIIIIIIIALFFQSCVVSFKCVLDLNFVLFCCCCICISSVNAQAGLYDMNFTLLSVVRVYALIRMLIIGDGAYRNDVIALWREDGEPS